MERVVIVEEITVVQNAKKMKVGENISHMQSTKSYEALTSKEQMSVCTSGHPLGAEKLSVVYYADFCR